MNTRKIIELLNNKAGTSFDVYERRPGEYQLILPILHEDGDMIDVYLCDSPKGKSYIRVCDFGMATMRLSYSYEINTDSRRRIFDSILINNDVLSDNGNLYLDVTSERLYEGIMQFVGCVQKVCNMRYWSRETIRPSEDIHRSFYEDLKEYTTTSLTKFNPIQDYSPIPDYKIITVDWSLRYKRHEFYLFGVGRRDKAKNTAIALLELEKARSLPLLSLPPFISLIVHEDMESLGKIESACLRKNANKQYETLDDFKEGVTSDIKRFAA